ncbi:MAG TPA: hypothetical protein VK728_13600 [Candidatus Sulfotelmatobacter sp.]|nr:hypothetical protein [Candidatus Sulfotelmatobacter sp.]
MHLSPELQAKVERAAAENKSGAEKYVKQLVDTTSIMTLGSASR